MARCPNCSEELEYIADEQISKCPKCKEEFEEDYLDEHLE